MFITPSKFHSVTRWESSYFGGHLNVLLDHPYIDLPDEIQITTKEDDLLSSSFLRTKLIKILLNNLSDNFIEDTLSTLLRKSTNVDNSYVLHGPVTMTEIIKSCKKYNSEIAGLFEYYRNVILNSKITITLPPNSKKQKGEGEGDGKSKDQKKEKDKESKCTTSPIGAVKEILKDIRKQNKREKLPDAMCDKVETVFELFTRSKNSFIPAPDEITASNRIVNLLDISFDPIADKVTNLKTGKIDFSKLSEVVAGNTSIYYKDIEDQKTMPFSICVLLDESGSMSSLTSSLKKFCSVFYTAFTAILPINKVFIYGHTTAYDNGREQCLVNVYNDPSNLRFEDTYGNIGREMHNNLDGFAIASVHKRVREFTSDKVLFITVSDGYPCGLCYSGETPIQHMKKVIERARRDDFVTLGLGLKHDVDHIYDYSYNIKDPNNEWISGFARMVNFVVKKEFK